jgi:hypothetical protein
MTSTTTLGSVLITAILANGMPVQIVQGVGNNTLADFREMYAELVKSGEYQTATVSPYGYRNA